MKPALPRLFAAVLAVQAVAAAAAPRNILLVIADDYGADACALYNTNAVGRPKIPAIESLATNGVVFRHAYANPVCSPTRACLMTGRFSFRTGVGDAVGPGTPQLSAAEVTLPDSFAAGAPDYRLAQFGKWHLATGFGTPASVGGWPLYVGNIQGQLTNYFAWTRTSNGVPSGTTAYATTDLVNSAVSWMAAQGTNRWFAWCAFNAPHNPLHKPPTNLCPDYTGLSGTQQDINTNSRAYYEAMVQSLDTELARLLASVDRTNTTIVFLGDNGTQNQAAPPPVLATRAKDTLYEGGIHVPLVIAGPEVAAHGRTNDTVVNAADLFATILALAGVDAASVVPTNVPLDSRSLLPVLLSTNNATLPRYGYSDVFGAGVAASEGGQALRNGQFKLIRFDDHRDEFYDLLADPYEVTNLLTNALSAAAAGNYNGLSFALGRYQAVFTNAITGLANGNAVTLPRDTNLVYTLWRAPQPSDNAWVPLTNALTSTNGGLLTLTDTNAPEDGAFYSVMGAPP